MRSWVVMEENNSCYVLKRAFLSNIYGRVSVARYIKANCFTVFYISKWWIYCWYQRTSHFNFFSTELWFGVGFRDLFLSRAFCFEHLNIVLCYILFIISYDKFKERSVLMIHSIIKLVLLNIQTNFKKIYSSEIDKYTLKIFIG